MTDPEFDSRIHRFEQAWRLHGPAAIEDFLGEPSGTRPGWRGRLLTELICVDLEYRWRNVSAAAPPSLEAYVERFPELVSLDRLPLGLVGEAYRARHRWGDRPSHAEFLVPFCYRLDEVRGELARIDSEIEGEDEPRAGHLSPSRVHSEPGPSAEGAEAPLLSHRDFLLRRLIGAGGNGKVYEARRHAGGGDVAVKFLRKGLLTRPEVVRRFLDEARTVAGLCHPNIVGGHGLGRTDAGSHFLVMELVNGPDLAARAGGRGVAEGVAVGWALEVCDAIAHAHGRGVVHCDLKPANILVDECGRIKVTDFGLARSLAGGPAGARFVEGTAPFMAPEQASRAWGEIDARTDVYGIGAVLFALLTGRPPHVGLSLPEVLAAVAAPTPVISPVRLRPGLTGPLGDVCRKCLAKGPAARYQTAREVRSALAGLWPGPLPGPGSLTAPAAGSPGPGRCAGRGRSSS